MDAMLFAKNIQGTGQELRRRKVTWQLPVAKFSHRQASKPKLPGYIDRIHKRDAYATDKSMRHAVLVSCTAGYAFLPPTVFASKTLLVTSVYLRGRTSGSDSLPSIM